jgi:hypothetical protein
MEFKELPRFALLIVLIGMIVGIGVLVLDKLASSPSVANTVSVTNESFTWPDNASNVTLAHGNITSFTQILNGSSVAVDPTNYTVLSTDGKITALQNTSICKTGASCFATYSWSDKNTKAATAFGAASDAVADIANSWIGLMVLVGALAIILVFVIRNFGGDGAVRK